MKKQSNHSATTKRENDKTKKASDSKDENSESEDVFTQDDFEDALRRVSRKISEPDEETKET